MVRFSQILVSIISILALLWSITGIIGYSSIIHRGIVECDHHQPVVQGLIFEIFLFSLSVVGLIGAILGNRRLLLVYTSMLFVSFAWLFLSSITLWAVSNVNDPKPAKDHKEYQLNKYPGWLQRYIVGGEKWVPIKRCMVKDQTCKGLLFEKDTTGGRNARNVSSPHLHGCCVPPSHCGFVHTNDTYWEAAKSSILSEDPDCQTWKNNLDQLCYDCNSCKAGYIRTQQDNWGKDADFFGLKPDFVFISFWIALWAFQQAPRDDHYRYTANNLSAA